MIKGELMNQYDKYGDNGVYIVSVYQVISGTDEEIAAYSENRFDSAAEADVECPVDENGTPLFYVVGSYGDVINIVPGKVRDRVTKELVDGYRARNTEDFRIREAAIRRSMAPAPVRKAVLKVTSVKKEDAEF
jgi:hypothetical protein